jgi:FtsP/CotA-like multicopper oxidase with cupredoxin domain
MHPDNMAPPLLTTYMFGFRDVTGMTDQQVAAQKMKVQAPAPPLWLEEYDPATDQYAFKLKVTNLGLQMRPDLIDAHTLHFHGFRNAIPIFDGEPHSSVAIPIARDLMYLYRARNPGTYMYHCHFEETEHVHMGMVGPAVIRPRMNRDLAPRKFAYNDESTEFDREFIVFSSEVWLDSHWADSHVQLPEWSDYRPEFHMLNGRVYPDTLAPNSPGWDPVTGDLLPPAGRPELQYQPMSGLINVNAGDRVLLRFINLGFLQHTMTLAGIKMKVIARDATQLKNTDGTDLSFETNSVSLSTGQSVDAIFVAPSVGAETTYLLYNRNGGRSTTPSLPGHGGMMTEVHVFPAGTLPPQTAANT